MKKFSLPSFFIGAGAGFILGVLLLGLFVNYLITHALSSASTENMFLGSAVSQVREGIAASKAQTERTSVYGYVKSIGGGTLVITVANTEGDKDYAFTYDDNTQFVYIANDAASSEVPLSTDMIEERTGLLVSTNEAVGSVPSQYAVKVIRL